MSKLINSSTPALSLFHSKNKHSLSNIFLFDGYFFRLFLLGFLLKINTRTESNVGVYFSSQLWCSVKGS